MEPANELIRARCADAGEPAARVDGRERRVCLLPNLAFSSRMIGGRRTHVCHHHQKGNFFHLGPAEYEAARLLDGNRGAAEVAGELNRRGIAWTAADVAKLMAMLVQSGLAQIADAPAAGEGTNAADEGEKVRARKAPPSRHGEIARGLSALLSQRINLFNGDRVAAKLVGAVGFVFSPPAVAIWGAIVVSGALIVGAHRVDFAAELRRFFSPQSWPLMVLMWCLIKMAHEAGHAVAARRQGVRVGRAGIILFLFAPLAFVDVTDAWRLSRRWPRVQIALAGMYVELGIAGIAAWLWWWSDAGFGRHLAAQIVMLAGPATLLVNANPFLRLDGYYVLGDVLDIPNLRMHGRRQLTARLESWLFRRPCPAGLLEGWRASAATAHAAASVIFQMVWMGGLILAVSHWARGLGVVLGAAAVSVWCVLPACQWMARVRRDGSWPAARRRVLAVGGLAGIALGWLCVLPSPVGRRVPVVVDYRGEQIARAAANGFVIAVPVEAGQRVRAGDVLVEMDDPELRVQRASLALDAEAAQLRARRLSREGRVALAAAEIERHEGLLRSLAELDRQIDSLRIRAQRDGVVCSRNPQRWLGRFVERGDVLVSIGEEGAKEVLASIEGSDLAAYLQAVEQGQLCQVRLRGGQRFAVIPAAPQPRVRQTIPHPALAASAGGPLAVEPHRETTGRDTYRLIAPRSESRSRLREEISRRVWAGQQGMLVIGDSRSLVRRIADPLRGLLKGSE